MDYPFEFHVTIAGDPDTFENACWDLGVKALRFESFGIIHNVSSSTKKCSTADAALELIRLTNEFQNLGVHVVRSKIETVPHHPWAIGKRFRYFEVHTKNDIAVQCGYTTNFSPTTADSKSIGFSFPVDMRGATISTPIMTIRTKSLSEIQQICKGLSVPDSEEIECCLYDTNPNLDDHWLRT